MQVLLPTPTWYLRRSAASPLSRLPFLRSPIIAGMSTADGKRVVVCGGGVIGACTAYFLAEEGAAHVTVIERSAVACAASGKAGGFLALDWCDSGPVGPLARASFHLHRTLARRLDGARSYGYRPLSALSLPLDPSSASPAAGSAAAPWIDGAGAGPARTIGTEETTAQVHPQLFTRAVLAAAADRVEVVVGEVGRVEAAAGRAVGVVLKGDGRFVPADAVVLALGPWSSRIPFVADLFRVSGLKAHSIVLRPRDSAAITAHALFVGYRPSPGAETLDPEVYPRPTGEVYICGMSRETEVPDDPEEIAGDPASIAMLHKIAGEVSSHLRDGEAEVVAEQACYLPCTDDGLPVIGELPGIEGCYVATGHS